jgi:molybdenum ABC transporter molybdate-binding protein
MVVCPRMGTLLLFIAAFAATAEGKTTERHVTVPDQELKIVVSPELGPAVAQLARRFEEKHPSHVRVTSLDSADAKPLADQLTSSAPDALFLADMGALRRLAASGIMVASSITSVARDQIVICVSPTFRLQFPSRNPLLPLRDKIVEHIAIADPHTSFGKVTTQTLRNAHVYDTTLKRKLLVQPSVSAVAEAMERGDAELALLPKSALQAYSLRGARVIKVPASLQPPLTIRGAVVRRSQHQREALAFLRFAGSAEGKEVFRLFGFEEARRTSPSKPST